jgi:hypothetical protein
MNNENLVTWLIMLAAFISVVVWGGMSLDFQSRCKSTCGTSRSLTPIMNLEEVCLCDEGHGQFRKVEIE